MKQITAIIITLFIFSINAYAEDNVMDSLINAINGNTTNNCDFNNDGTVDEFETKYCQCDFNGDGAVDPEEQAKCDGIDPENMPCDFNQDTMIDEWEKKYCGCDFNGNGMIEEDEEAKCNEMHNENPCDLNHDTMIDEWEEKYCKCDFNRDGVIDEEEEAKCNEIHEDPQDDCKEAYEAGRQACIEDPASCGIEVNTPNHMPECKATFNFLTNSLHIPCLDMGGLYWLDMEMIDAENYTFQLKDFGEK